MQICLKYQKTLETMSVQANNDMNKNEYNFSDLCVLFVFFWVCFILVCFVLVGIVPLSIVVLLNYIIACCFAVSWVYFLGLETRHFATTKYIYLSLQLLIVVVGFAF